MGEFTAWHTIEPRDALARLGVDGDRGLAEQDAAKRLA